MTPEEINARIATAMKIVDNLSFYLMELRQEIKDSYEE